MNVPTQIASSCRCYHYLSDCGGRVKTESKVTILHSFRPIINPSGEKNLIFRCCHGIFALIGANRKPQVLPVIGIPKEIGSSDKLLRRFFFHTYFTKETVTKPQYNYVRVSLKLKGGGPFKVGSLPIYREGQVILKAVIENLLLQKKIEKKEDELEFKTSDQKEIQYEAYKKNQDRSNESSYQTEEKYSKCKNDISKIMEDLNNLYSEQKQLDPDMPFVESLPIDFRLSPTKYIQNNFISEATSYCEIEHSDMECVKEKVEHSINCVLSDRSSRMVDILAYKAINEFTAYIKTNLSNQTKIKIISSFLTLPQMRKIERIRFRADAKLRDELIANANQYYVIDGVILGGLLLAAQVEVIHSPDPEKVEQHSGLINKVLSSYVIDKGGGLTFENNHNDNMDLKELANRWKKKLLNDPQSGYPISYTYSELSTILDENPHSVAKNK